MADVRVLGKRGMDDRSGEPPGNGVSDLPNHRRICAGELVGVREPLGARQLPGGQHPEADVQPVALARS